MHLPLITRAVSVAITPWEFTSPASPDRPRPAGIYLLFGRPTYNHYFLRHSEASLRPPSTLPT